MQNIAECQSDNVEINTTKMLICLATYARYLPAKKLEINELPYLMLGI